MKANSFDILKTMSARNVPSFKLFPLANVTDLRIGKDGWGRVTFALDNATIQSLLNDTMNKDAVQNIVVLTWSIAEYNRIRDELEQE